MLKTTSNTAIWYVLLSVPRTATSSYFPSKTSFQKLQFQHKIIFLVFFQFHIINNNKMKGVQFFLHIFLVISCFYITDFLKNIKYSVQLLWAKEAVLWKWSTTFCSSSCLWCFMQNFKESELELLKLELVKDP